MMGPLSKCDVWTVQFLLQKAIDTLYLHTTLTEEKRIITKECILLKKIIQCKITNCLTLYLCGLFNFFAA